MDDLMYNWAMLASVPNRNNEMQNEINDKGNSW